MSSFFPTTFGTTIALIFLWSGLAVSETLFVKVQEVQEKVWKQSFLLELQLEDFDSKSRGYSATITLPHSSWRAPRGAKLTVQLPTIRSEKVTAQILNCQELRCALRVNYPHRGLRRQKAMAEWSFHPGQFVFVPLQAVISPTGKETFVYVQKDQKVSRRPIVVWRGLQAIGLTLEGLSPGEQVVVSGYDRLVDQQTVEVVQ